MARLAEEIVTGLDKLVILSPHPYGALLGLEIVDAEEDCVRVRLPYRDDRTVCDSDGKPIAFVPVIYMLSMATAPGAEKPRRADGK